MRRYILIVYAGMLLSACHSKKLPSDKRNNAIASADVIIASPRNISNIVEANGTVVANEYVQLHPEASGRITYLNVPEGVFVNQGTIIARINDADLQAQLSKSKVQLELAVKTEERLKKLLAINGINQADYDSALNQLQSIQTDIAYYQALIDKTVVKAPFSGTVGLRLVSIGAYVTPADVIASIQQLNTLKIDFTLPESYGTLVHKGNVVSVELDATDTIKQRATIVAVEPQANTITRNLKVRATLQNTKTHPGSFVKVYIDAGENKHAIMVPTNALIPNDQNNQVVILKNGRAKFVSVETGIRQAANVEITKGISEGDSVLVTGVLFARPDAVIKVNSVKTL
ncbi:efflux RND transporter periplasmic adaptor subunit [Chitinophaga sp. CF118]|uniref:efflux RND transporter periplasmic adaptor subunit n=1 Tax=Chitinophaga sp. CF118 TaxID=1884367 RepID=UPI0021018928|nr:efflux RND transporter periplasmic adaptor subunit [Chitinophaga sp. CF118]